MEHLITFHRASTGISFHIISGNKHDSSSYRTWKLTQWVEGVLDSLDSEILTLRNEIGVTIWERKCVKRGQSLFQWKIMLGSPVWTQSVLPQ